MSFTMACRCLLLNQDRSSSISKCKYHRIGSCTTVLCLLLFISSDPLGIKYNVSIAERRFNPRAILDNPSKLQPQNLTLLPGEETCEHIYFHVMVSHTASVCKDLRWEIGSENVLLFILFESILFIQIPHSSLNIKPTYQHEFQLQLFAI